MGLGDTLKKHLDPEVLAASMSRLATTVKTTFDSDHRHDDADEKERDAKMQAICDSHRFRSFSNTHEGNAVKWYSCGHDYFWALSEILDNARSSIFILDWWLSPTLYLRRPPAQYEDFRVDRLLKRKAEQGVKIYIVVYKEITQTMTMSSSHTKHHLEDLHENIQVMRHPDHLGGEVTLYWSHHEKLVVADNTLACVGGMDICMGRWDTQLHPLADVHPTDMHATLFPGIDYNNARVEDFLDVGEFLGNHQSPLEIGRMPWQDLHTTLTGPAVLDLSHHFIERWNFIKRWKYRHEKHYEWLAFPHGAEEPSRIHAYWDSVRDHPHTPDFHKLGTHFAHPFSSFETDELVDRHRPANGRHAEWPGNSSVQVVRSSADWSSGILTEHSIQNAYIQLINEASHCIYIENQFFVSSTEPGGPVSNQIGAALANRIISAHQSGTKFRVYVVVPTFPCFAGEFKETMSIMCIIDYQMKGIRAILDKLRQAGISNPEEYISFFNLRGYDRINNDQAMLAEMEQRSGISFHQVQVALARIYAGDGYKPGQKIKIKNPATDVEKTDENGKKLPIVVAEVELPATVEEAEDLIRRFQDAAPRDDREVRDSVAHCLLHGQPSIVDEVWKGSAEHEKAAFVTEEIYPHSKCMIVDDRTVIIGSANINERSQVGDHDSEIAIVIEDRDLFESTMDGKPYMASKFAASFRRHLFRQHLGLVQPQFCDERTGRTYPTDAMRPAPHPVPDPSESGHDEWERIVVDPLSDELEAMWKGQARQNTQVYEDVFRVVPSDRVRTWKDYDEFFPKPPIKTGHVADPQGMQLEWIKEQLAKVKGHLVELPHNFLVDEDLAKKYSGPEVNPVTLPIYL
ncbi:hypothetical protein OC844_000851 [Tilletia horrida]|nr:hypothetical protein OC844_000851 [Tilletia horrida]